MKLNSNSKIYIWVAAILLGLQLVSQIYLANKDSQTTDEAVHLLSGYTYLTRHDFRFNPEHPVLVKSLAAVPLLFMDVKMPDDFESLWDKSSDFFYDSWRESRALGEEFLYQSGNNPEKLLFWGRLPIVLLTLLLGISILIASKKFFNASGALIATAVYVFNPIILAHGHLITTDIAVSLGYFLTIFALLFFFKNRSWKNLILLAISFAFALLVKFTAVILVPVGLVLLSYAYWTNMIPKGSRLKTFLGLILACLISWLLIWAAYGFKSEVIPDVPSISQAMIEKNSPQKSNVDVLPEQSTADKTLKTISPLLIPRDYFKGLFMVLSHVEGGHDSFLLGNLSNKGWWYYFPVVFAAKNTIPALILIGLSIFLTFSIKKNRKEKAFILIGSALFMLFAMLSKANLGVRHILPVMPLLIFLCAQLVQVKGKAFRYFVIVLAAWLVFEAVVNFPYYLSYFNQLFGGRENGYKIASDSNLDWGRDLREIASYVDEKNLAPLYIEYGWNGSSSLKYYGIQAEEANNITQSSEGYLIIGGSAVDSQKFKWLDSLPIYDKITPSVFVYKLNIKDE